jgi:hypothetical protein
MKKDLSALYPDHLSPEMESPVHVDQETEWASELVLMLQRRVKSLSLPETRPNSPVIHPVV